MAKNPNVGPEPVKADPNHVREKTYTAPKTPDPVKEELRELPEDTAEDKVRDEMPEAVDAVKKRV